MYDSMDNPIRTRYKRKTSQNGDENNPPAGLRPMNMHKLVKQTLMPHCSDVTNTGSNDGKRHRLDLMFEVFEEFFELFINHLVDLLGEFLGLRQNHL